MSFIGRDHDELRTFTRRTVILGGLGASLFSLVGTRLYQIQVAQHDYYARLAEDNRVNRRILAPLRGKILDRFGAVLAGNDANYRVVLIPEQTADQKGRLQVGATMDRLARVIHISDRTRQRVMREARNGPRFRPIMIAEGLSWADFSRINVLVPDLPGIQPEVGERRSYPMGAGTAHVLGYVARVSERDIETITKDAEKRGEPIDPEFAELLRHPTFRIGKNGIEQTAERDLRGSAGARHVEVNAFGREIKEVARHDGEPGRDLVLTLDAEIQAFAMDRVKDESASVVVLDIETGDVLVLASAPGFDPHAFGVGLTNAQWAALRDNEYNPLINKPVSGLYPPGSTFKMVPALAALETGAMRPDRSVYCGGRYFFGERFFHCWKKEGHGWVDMHDGIKKSCDVYFYECARLAGIEAIAKTAKDLGFGTNYDFALPGTKSGIVPNDEWKRRVYNEKWHEGETLSVGIGQGYMLATPLQLAVMAARIANGGYAIVPRLVRASGDQVIPPPAAPKIGFRADSLDFIRDGMNAVSNEIGGTAYGARIPDEGFELAGKTGTAQVRVISAAERVTGVIKNEDLPWKLRDHALFVAFAPVHRPRYSISVVVDHGGSGSKAAAPIARDIMKFTLTRDPLSRRPIDALRTALANPAAAGG